MEPERKIEKLLRAYAQKRRAAAGDPLKLHPATRRLLQDEVSRHAPKPEPEEPSVSLWQLFRQQWAILFGFALMVFLGAMLFLPAVSASKKRAQSISAMNNLQQIGVAAQMVAGENNGKLPATLDELTNGLVSRQTLTDPVSGKPFVYVAGSKNLEKLESNDVLAYSPADKAGRAVLLADGRVEFAEGERFAELTNPKSVAFVMAEKMTSAEPAKTVANEPVPATMPPVVLGAAGELKEQPAGSGAMPTFEQTAAANQQNLYQNMSVSAKKVSVLQSFQMVQNGDVVSVVDRDGSVYHGSVQVELEKDKEAAEAMAPKEEAPLVQSLARADQQERNPQPTAQNYFFRVAGVNRTLKQNVVFSGTVEAVPGALTNALQTFAGGGGGGGGQSNLQDSTNQQQSLLSNSRVVGTAVIDQTNQIEINAIPVTQ
jgi:type II secretory pathway pseudopilin PulG